MTILVTGASGFLGRHLTASLLRRGHAVRTLSRSQIDCLPPHVEHFAGDIRNETLLEAAMAGVETVFHAAAIVPGFGAETEMWETNVAGTRSVAQACLRARVRRLVLVSSIAVYKPPLADLVAESAPIGGSTIYGRSKTMSETVAADICRGRLELVIARPCQMFGACDRTGFTKKLLRLLKSNLLPVAGLRGRSFSLIHVSDVTGALCTAGERKDLDGAVFNLAGKQKTSLLELASIYSGLAGKKSRGTKLPIPGSILRTALSLQYFAKNIGQARRDSPFGAYGPRSTHNSILLGGPRYDIERATTLLGFNPGTSFEQGLLELIGEEAVQRRATGREAPESIAMTRS